MNEHVPEVVPPAVKVRGDLQVTVSFPEPDTVFETTTGPVNPLVVAGLPRLVTVVEIPADLPALKVRLVVFVANVKPLTLTVCMPEVLEGRLVAFSEAW